MWHGDIQPSIGGGYLSGNCWHNTTELWGMFERIGSASLVESWESNTDASKIYDKSLLTCYGWKEYGI